MRFNHRFIGSFDKTAHMHTGAPVLQLDGGDSVPATIFLMSTAVIPKERHAGEKTARQVGLTKERETISACLLLQRAHGPLGLLHKGGERWSEDGLGLPEEGIPLDGGFPSPRGINGPDPAGICMGTGEQVPPALTPISCRGANHLLGIWPTLMNWNTYCFEQEDQFLITGPLPEH